jgi:hypothetical protein
MVDRQAEWNVLPRKPSRMNAWIRNVEEADARGELKQVYDEIMNRF